MTELKTKQKEQAESDAAIAEFLAKGGVIQQLDYNATGWVEGQTQIYGMPRRGAGRPKTPEVTPDTTD